jgi:hypothetical protein
MSWQGVAGISRELAGISRELAGSTRELVRISRVYQGVGKD